jgi:hypothetical protein
MSASARWEVPWNVRRTSARLFLTCWIVYSLHFATNTVRELYPVMTLGDRASFDVSPYLGFHDDIFEIPGRGAFINNNPGASILGAVPYVLARPLIETASAHITARRAAENVSPTEYDTVYPMAREFYRRARAEGLDIKFALVAAVTQTGVMATVSALGVAVMYRVLVCLGLSARAALWMALLYGFATPVFYRTAHLNHNLLLAHSAFFAFVLLWRPWKPGNRPRFFAAGQLAAWAVVLDFSGVVALAALSIYALQKWLQLPQAVRGKTDLLRFAAGAALSLAVLATYQWVQFGNPVYPAQHYMPAANYSDAGYRGFDWPRPDLLLATAFDIRFGLFVSAPFLLFALRPTAWRGRGSSLLDREEWRLAVGFASAFFVFCAANQYGWMQFNSGVRHVVPVVPFLFLLAAGPFIRLGPRVATLLGAAAIYWSWCLSMYRDVEQGLGVVEAVRAVSTGGPRLPWVTTLRGLGYVEGQGLTWLALAAAAVAITLIWIAPRSARFAEPAIEAMPTGDSGLRR